MASELFENIFHSGTSGAVRTCQCGRTYFDDSDESVDWEEGELEQLEEEAERNPEMFIRTDYSVPTMTVMSTEIVFNCPCKYASMYENFINRHDRQVAEYLNKKAKELREKADEIEVK